MKKAIATLISLICVSGAHAASWVQVSDYDKNFGVLLIEAESIERTGNLAHYWKWAVFPQTWGTATAKPFNNVKSKTVADCVEKTMGTTFTNAYMGTLLISEESKPLEMKPVVPGTVGMDELEAVCKKRLPGKVFQTYEQVKATFPKSK